MRPDTYATSELSLREAMSAGVPPVVFPYGGIPDLVEDGRTGLVVTSEDEYVAAVERLARDPDTRRRLGQAAAEFIRSQFSMAAGGRRFDAVYQALLQAPKQERVLAGPGLDAPPAARFVAALGAAAPEFGRSLVGPDADAERHIAAVSTLLVSGEGGVMHYRNTYPDDPYLRFWAGLVLLGQGRTDGARREFQAAVERGLDPARIRDHVELGW